MPKKKRKISGPVLLAIFLLVIMSVIALYLYYSNDKGPKPVRYPAFRIHIPPHYKIHGIDISHHQSHVNWTDVKNMSDRGKKIGFAFIKATDGISNVDRQFRRNWNELSKIGMPRGAYHFFLPNRDPEQQARHFIRNVRLRKGDMPPVLDVEQTLGMRSDGIRQGVSAWLNVVENHYGVKPIIYTNVDFYERHLSGTFDDYPLWVAHYLRPQKPRISRSWTFWQHSESGRVNGIRSRVDFNVFNGDSADFTRLLIGRSIN